MELPSKPLELPCEKDSLDDSFALLIKNKFLTRETRPVPLDWSILLLSCSHVAASQVPPDTFEHVGFGGG